MEQKERHFRFIASLILGTQLAFLEELALREPIERDDVKYCYDFYRKRCAEEIVLPNSFDDWAGYLIPAGIIEEDQGAYTLTDLGRDFILNFAPANSLSLKTRSL